ncbi:uncharacterized protein LOC122508750 [Leptopilina heterotoma]|uniref:uncharacterized protein LOC122508750 n=1 Tax=Leptopilina heterotoma TaxID=63436 RepID=UPI001CA98D24|nr:uncharacterized protein LOC122508750 [Leptopilina heterotoma]
MVKRKSVSPVEVEHLKKQFKLIQETMKNVIGDASDPESDVDSSSTEEVRDHLSEDEDPETDPDRQSSKENDNVKGEGDPSTKKQEENNGEIPMNEEFAEIFGLDPNASKAIESKLHSGILSRWKFWASKGQKADDVEKLLEKYQSPTGLEEPKLNPEILLKLAKHSKTRDSHMTKRQRLIGAALTSLGSAMSSLMDDTESIDKLIFMERMNDIGKILTEIFYSQTKSRIAFILAGLDKETKALLEDRQTEEFLFGKNLSKRIKEAKAMDKVASSIKKQLKPKIPVTKNLNYNNQHPKWPTPSTSGTQQNFQNRRLYFKTKQPFNPRAPYQGQNRQRNQQRPK